VGVIHGENVKHFPLLCHKQNAVVMTCRITFSFLFLRLALDGERIQQGTGEGGGPPGDGEGRGQDPVGRRRSEHFRDAPGDRSGESFFFSRAMLRQFSQTPIFIFFISVHQDYTQETYVLLAEYDENGVLVIPDQVHATYISFFFPPPLFVHLI
jgi:hypothetical protein